MLTHLSPSSISSILSCPKRWVLGKEINNPTTGEAQFIGDKFHKALGGYFTWLRDGVELTLEDLVHGLEQGWSSNNDVEWVTSPAQALMVTKRLVTNYYNWSKRQTMIPVDIETRMELEIGRVKVVGIRDLKLADGRIIDWKTSGNLTLANNETKKLVQPLVYSLLDAGGDIEKASKIKFEYHFALKDQDIIDPRIIYSRKQDLRLLVNELLPKVWMIIEQGLWYPNWTSPDCTPRRCQSWRDCRG